MYSWCVESTPVVDKKWIWVGFCLGKFGNRWVGMNVVAWVRYGGFGQEKSIGSVKFGLLGGKFVLLFCKRIHMWVWFGVFRFGFGLWKSAVDKRERSGNLLGNEVVEKWRGVKGICMGGGRVGFGVDSRPIWRLFLWQK